MLKRAIAVLVLLLVAAVAVKLVVGFVSSVLWIVVVVALAVAALWARSTLRSAKASRTVKPSPAKDLAAAPEDRVAVEMRRITEQLREQGRTDR
jgi:beta-lactamase regulating signal transducer with metallopeptidase domain